MLRTTAVLLQRQGYQGTGLNQVVAESGTPKGSMYFHFPGGKEQLAAEAIELSGQRVVRSMRRDERETALASFDAHVERTMEYLERSNFVDGCPIATVALEVGPTSDLVGTACLRAFGAIEDELVGWLQRDGYAPDEARSMATLTLAAFEGTLILAKARRSVQPLRDLRAALPRMMPPKRRTRARV
jgi:TetR/AcrR family transcriptional repressor of lmrAB and yxaGH operons